MMDCQAVNTCRDTLDMYVGFWMRGCYLLEFEPFHSLKVSVQPRTNTFVIFICKHMYRSANIWSNFQSKS